MTVPGPVLVRATLEALPAPGCRVSTVPSRHPGAQNSGWNPSLWHLWRDPPQVTSSVPPELGVLGVATLWGQWALPAALSSPGFPSRPTGRYSHRLWGSWCGLLGPGVFYQAEQSCPQQGSFVLWR